MEIKEWLDRHDGISLHWVEIKLGLKAGTLKKDRPIPGKYVEGVKGILRDYGFFSDEVVVGRDKKVDGVRRYIVRKDMLGYMDGLLFKRSGLEDGTVLVLE